MIWLVVLVLGVWVAVLQRRLIRLQSWVQGVVANADDNFANCVTYDELRETCFEASDTRTLRELLDDRGV
jgi:hypothetical protein